MPNSAAMLRCSSLRFVLSTLSARWSSQLNSMVNNDLIRLSVFSIFALFILLGTNQVQTHALHLARTFTNIQRLGKALLTVQRCLAARCRMNRRKKPPNTYQLLLQATGP